MHVRDLKFIFLYSLICLMSALVCLEPSGAIANKLMERPEGVHDGDPEDFTHKAPVRVGSARVEQPEAPHRGDPEDYSEGMPTRLRPSVTTPPTQGCRISETQQIWAKFLAVVGSILRLRLN